MRELTNQLDLFADNSWRKTFQVIPKLPYSFSYRFEDAVGKSSELQVLDWEAGALYWNCLRSVDGDEPKALAKVRQKYYDMFLKTDLHFFLGTTQQFHFVAPEPVGDHRCATDTPPSATWAVLTDGPPPRLPVRTHSLKQSRLLSPQHACILPAPGGGLSPPV